MGLDKSLYLISQCSKRGSKEKAKKAVMKWIFCLLFLFFFECEAQIDGTCEECIEFIQASSQLFASPQVLDITQVFLKQDVCQQMEDIEGCERDVDLWYRPMMQAGLVSEDFGERFCYHYGICQQKVRFSSISIPTQTRLKMLSVYDRAYIK